MEKKSFRNTPNLLVHHCPNQSKWDPRGLHMTGRAPFRSTNGMSKEVVVEMPLLDRQGQHERVELGGVILMWLAVGMDLGLRG